MSDLPLDHVHIAPDDDPAGKPAVFVLHGRGADEQDLLPIATELGGEKHIVSLQAPDPLQGGYTWYELDLSGGGLHQSQPDPADFRRSLDLVAESVSTAVDRYDLDPDRLGLLGFSQGAITSLSLVLESPDLVAWVVGLHGYLPDSHTDLEPDGIVGKPVFIGGGTGDRVIPIERVHGAVERFEELGADVTHETYPVGHGVGPDELADVVAFVDAQW